MKKGTGPKIILTKQHKAKITQEMICKFMNQWENELNNPEKPNMTTKDYTLHQFWCWVNREE